MNIASLRQDADSGSVVAQTTLGICYLEGIDVEMDYRKHFVSCLPQQRRGPRALRLTSPVSTRTD